MKALARLVPTDVATTPAESLLAFARDARLALERLKKPEQLLDLYVVLVAVEKRLRQLGEDRRDAEAGQTLCLLRGGELLGPPGPQDHDGQGRFSTVSQKGDADGKAGRQLRWWMRRLAQYAAQVRSWLADEATRSCKPSAILGAIKQMEDEARVSRIGAEPPTLEIRKGDFRTVLADLPPESVDLVLTDPPYGADALSLWPDLGAWSAKVLRPGGSLVCYSGQSMLPEVFAALTPYLRYWWTFALSHRHGGERIPGKWVLCEWKPVLWFVRDHRIGRTYIGDRLQGGRTLKIEHPWAQGLDEALYLVSRITETDALVVDPMAGSGTFGYAARALERRFLGADLELS